MIYDGHHAKDNVLAALNLLKRMAYTGIDEGEEEDQVNHTKQQRLVKTSTSCVYSVKDNNILYSTVVITACLKYTRNNFLRKGVKKMEKKITTGSHDNADRRAGKHQGPYVNNGKLPRSRNNDGTWRKQRSDAENKKSE